MPRKQNKNLTQNSKRSPNEARENGKKGGIKSGEVRREKKTLKEVMSIILESDIPRVKNEYGKKVDSKIKTAMEEMGLPENEINIKSAILAGQATEAMKGNTRAAEYVFGLTGEQTTTESEQEKRTFELPARVLGSEYVDVNRSIDDREYSQYDFKGGRGSLKSSFCGLKIIDLIMLNEQFCALAVRQLKDNLRDSVYNQITWAIDELNLSEEFHCTVNPMQIKRIKTGQIIYFRGADDPGKIKSIKPPKDMHIGVASLNEIIIDDRRCPYTAEEFLTYEYERTKDGEIISGYPDMNNHGIDSVRYALEEIWKRRGE